MSDYSEPSSTLPPVKFSFTDIMHSGQPLIYMADWSSQREAVEP